MKLVFLALLAVSASSQQLARGKLLVATPISRYPDFAHSVVVLIRYDSDSAIGLMLTKPTNLTISEVLPAAKGNPAPVYAGGPVTIGTRALLPSKFSPFFAVISNQPQLLEMLSSGAPSRAFRIYAGYTGWTALQLQSEVTRVLWKVLPANAGALFDAHPETLWQRLSPSECFGNRP